MMREMVQPAVMPAPLLYPPADAARLLQISRATLYRLMDAAAIRSVKVGRARRIPHRELERIAREGAN